MKSFASDNYAGALPEVMKAIQEANVGHAASYGNDDWTRKTELILQEIFGIDIEVRFVFNGTGANVLSISASTLSYNAILCADIAHIYNDESSAPETFTGSRFFPIKTNDEGKITPEVLRTQLIRKGDLHYPQIKMLSLTQATEYGTVYSIDELFAISKLCKEHDLYFHIDGSRFFNAAASLGCSLADISSKVGVDILSLGGTKLGMLFGEAIIVFNKKLKEHLPYKHKQSMQLASKTRFIAAQFESILIDELWRKTASWCNERAQQLANGLSEIKGIIITKPTQANAVFATFPKEWNEALIAQFPFYIWREDINEARLMCAWDTTKEEVIALINAFKIAAEK